MIDNSTRTVKILVTGGSGFIGSNLLQSLSRNFDYDLLNIDIAMIDRPEFQSVTTICDIKDRMKLERIITDFNPNYIIHLAARTDLNGKKLSDYSSNIEGVRNIVEIASQLSCLKKILITSSMLVCKPGYQPVSNDDYCPHTLYGKSKVLTEQIARSIPLKCQWAFLRPTSIWGPGFKAPYRNFFDMVANRRYFHIGNRACTKTYGYIGNTVYQIERILFHTDTTTNGEVYYLGDPPLNIEKWANHISEQMGVRIHRVPFSLIKIAGWIGDGLKMLGISFPMTSFRLKNMTINNILDLSKTFQIAPNPPYSELEGIKRTIEWLRTSKKN